MTEKFMTSIDYTNWRGERRDREIVPIDIIFSQNRWHPEEQWMLVAKDVATGQTRHFAMKDIHGWSPLAVKAVEDAPWPAKCRDADSCYRHGQCMYSGCALSGHPKLKGWIDAERVKKGPVA